MNTLGLDALLTAALQEDVGTGDITTESCIPPEAVSRGRFLAKEDLVLCGLDVAKRVFALTDPTLNFTSLRRDGELVKKGEYFAEVSGCSRSILTGERVALNLMQRMCGIATRTAQAVSAVAGTKTRIVDTRKSTPGLRVLEKYAVRVGGGSNHRFNLSDGVLIKDNHISAAGGIREAIAAVRQNAPHTLRIEVETETLEQVDEAIGSGADIIMLDNMDNETMRIAVQRIAGRALTEASGNMGERDLRAVAETGVDFISVGALTHSVRSSDISLKFN
ncbi:MAG: carboxylating nicotinate-nucleotide diphosphorylase [Oscillospiraceae bacterium]|nr:carboxylating nicotinate-nucleotide diphosphorylase [Oscillospiraceae bacterium]